MAWHNWTVWIIYLTGLLTLAQFYIPYYFVLSWKEFFCSCSETSENWQQHISFFLWKVIFSSLFFFIEERSANMNCTHHAIYFFFLQIWWRKQQYLHLMNKKQKFVCFFSSKFTSIMCLTFSSSFPFNGFSLFRRETFSCVHPTSFISLCLQSRLPSVPSFFFRLFQFQFFLFPGMFGWSVGWWYSPVDDFILFSIRNSINRLFIIYCFFMFFFFVLFTRVGFLVTPIVCVCVFNCKLRQSIGNIGKWFKKKC